MRGNCGGKFCELEEFRRAGGGAGRGGAGGKGRKRHGGERSGVAGRGFREAERSDAKRSIAGEGGVVKGKGGGEKSDWADRKKSVRLGKYFPR